MGRRIGLGWATVQTPAATQYSFGSPEGTLKSSQRFLEGESTSHTERHREAKEHIQEPPTGGCWSRAGSSSYDAVTTPQVITQEPGTHWTLQDSKAPPLLICPYVSRSQREHDPSEAPPSLWAHSRRGRRHRA